MTEIQDRTDWDALHRALPQIYRNLQPPGRIMLAYQAIIRFIESWTPPPKPAPDTYRRVEDNQNLPAFLPAVRERSLTIGSVPEPNFVQRIYPGLLTQRTSNQQQCTFLTKLPAEIRIKIYRLVLGDQVLHIVPGLVPSRTRPSQERSSIPRMSTRFDYEPCVSNLGPLKRGVGGHHGNCTNWIDKGGKQLFLRTSPYEPSSPFRWMNPVEVARYVDTRYLEWWKRENGLLALLKTCRQIYSETVDILYTTNTFDFHSLDTLAQFTSTLLPQRVDAIRSLHLRFTSHRSQSPSYVSVPLKRMRGLREIVLIADDGMEKKTVEDLREYVTKNVADVHIEVIWHNGRD